MPDLTRARWRKSSYSNSNGGNCIEVADDLPGLARWRKSTYSNSAGGDCIEVAEGLTEVVPVRDSKDPDGPALTFTPSAWTAFITAVKAAHFPT